MQYAPTFYESCLAGQTPGSRDVYLISRGVSDEQEKTRCPVLALYRASNCDTRNVAAASARKGTLMPRSYRRLTALALTVGLALLITSATMPAAGATAAPSSDGLSGTWQVSRTCLTICVNPKPVLKVVSHLYGAVFTTGGPTPQMLYRIGKQVLVHGPKDSLLLNVETHGVLMRGRGVGADGSTFETTWRCVAAAATPVASATPVATVTTVTAVTTATPGAGAAAPLGIGGTRPQRLPLGISRC